MLETKSSQKTQSSPSSKVTTKMAGHYEQLISLLGENPHREGLKDTPERAAKALLDLTKGYAQDPVKVVGRALFKATSHELVLVRDIEFHSLCEHHLLPFFGKVQVAYYPGETIVGLSKIPRIVNIFAKRLQVQENMTREIATALSTILKPRGLAVLVEATHLCMAMRGVQETSSKTLTSYYTGSFRTDTDQKLELLAQLAIKT